jgi:hypothetical protein
MGSLQEWGGWFLEKSVGSDRESADMELRRNLALTIALIALAIVMLIWALVTWDEPVEQPERHRHV